MYQLLFILALVVLVFTIRHVRKQPPEQRRQLTWRYSLYAVAALLVGLVVTGRMHWIAGAIGAALPIIQRLLPWALRLLPFALRQRQHRTGQAPNTKTTMDKEQALKIFGFEAVPTKVDIIQRHRELIQKNHPDRGGSDYIAAQINEAKDILLNHVA